MSLQARFKKIALPAPAPADGPRFYTLKGAAAYLGLPEYNVRQAIREHIIKRVAAGTRGWRISKEELDWYANELNKTAFKSRSDRARMLLGKRPLSRRQLLVKKANALLRRRKSR